MFLDLNSDELCVLSLITWHGPLPLFEGIQGILPDGVKNSVKWKSKTGLKKLAKRLQKRLEKEGIWETAELENSMIAIIFYEQAVSVMGGGKHIASFYKSEEGLASITFCGDGDMYEIQDYKDESKWLTALCANCNSTLADEEIEMVIYSRNSDGEKKVLHTTYKRRNEEKQ